MAVTTGITANTITTITNKRARKGFDSLERANGAEANTRVRFPPSPLDNSPVKASVAGQPRYGGCTDSTGKTV